MEKICSICGCSVGNGTDKVYRFSDGNLYCKKHYLQMYRHGKILERTIYDKNEYIKYNDYAECICYDTKGNEKGRVKIDLDKINDLQNYKIYIRNQNGKLYAAISIDNKKILLHRYLFGIVNEKYDIDKVVDHINGDSLDNRLCNLRQCSHSQNMQNIRKINKIIGVALGPNKNKKWVARIMSNYKSIHIGTFNTKEEAVYARLLKEKELCGDYGPNKDLFYLLDQSSPIEAIKQALEDV